MAENSDFEDEDDGECDKELHEVLTQVSDRDDIQNFNFLMNKEPQAEKVIIEYFDEILYQVKTTESGVINRFKENRLN